MPRNEDMEQINKYKKQVDRVSAYTCWKNITENNSTSIAKNAKGMGTDNNVDKAVRVGGFFYPNK